MNDQEGRDDFDQDDLLEELGLAHEVSRSSGHAEEVPTGIPADALRERDAVFQYTPDIEGSRKALDELAKAVKDLGQHGAVLNRPKTRVRDDQIGFPPIVNLQPGQSITSCVTLNKYFRPQKLIAAELVNGIAVNTQWNGPSYTTITNIFVGVKSVFPSAVAGIPTSAFSLNSLGSGTLMPTAAPGETISITVTNTSQTACDWHGALFGKSII